MKVRRHARNVFCKVNGHRWINIGCFWKCFACGDRRITRKALLDELLPGLNALFGLEYPKYDHTLEYERILLETN